MKTTNFSIKQSLSDLKPALETRVKDYKKLRKNDYSGVMRIDYLRAEYRLRRMIFRTEKTLFNKRTEDLPDENRIKSIEKTLDGLNEVHQEMVTQHQEIIALKNENQLLKERIKYHGIK